MSPTQTWLGVSTVKLRSTRLGAIGRPWRLSVVAIRKRRLPRARYRAAAADVAPAACPRRCPEPAVAARCAAIRRLLGSSHKRRGYAPATPRHSGGDAGECLGGELSVHGSQIRLPAAPGTAR